MFNNKSTIKTTAAVLNKLNHPFEIEELDLQEPDIDEVLVRIKAVGVCRSDWHLVTGSTQHPLPLVAGHEGAGIVEQVGKNVTNIKPGDHVVLSWAPYCGDCYYCNIKRTSLCETYSESLSKGTMLDGTTRLFKKGKPVYHYCGLACFSEYTTVPVQSCVSIKEEISLKTASLIGCAVTTGIGSAINTAKVRKGSNVVVFGCGGVGLSTIMGAKLADAKRIIAIDVFSNKAEIAKKVGATDFILSDENTIDKTKEFTNGRGADFVFETTGIINVQEESLNAARPAGTIVLVGLSAMGSKTNLPGAEITRQEKIIMGSYYGTSKPDRDFRFITDQLIKGNINLDALISKTYSLEQINEAFRDMLTGNYARGIIEFD